MGVAHYKAKIAKLEKIQSTKSETASAYNKEMQRSHKADESTVGRRTVIVISAIISSVPINIVYTPYTDQ